MGWNVPLGWKGINCYALREDFAMIVDRFPTLPVRIGIHDRTSLHRPDLGARTRPAATKRSRTVILTSVKPEDGLGAKTEPSVLVTIVQLHNAVAMAISSHRESEYKRQ
jgi:hypothetical protein